MPRIQPGRFCFSQQAAPAGVVLLSGPLTAVSGLVARGDLRIHWVPPNWIDFDEKIGEVEVRRVTENEFTLVVRLKQQSLLGLTPGTLIGIDFASHQQIQPVGST